MTNNTNITTNPEGSVSPSISPADQTRPLILVDID